MKHDLRKRRPVLHIKRLARQTCPRLHDWIFWHPAAVCGSSGGSAKAGVLFARQFLTDQKCHPASTLLVCCSSDASRHPACAVDIVQ